MARLPDPLDPTVGRQALVHTDVFPDNTVFEDDGVLAGLLDFEEVCVGPCLLDVAMAVAGCCVAGLGSGGSEAMALRPAHVHALVSGYEDVAGPLTAAERSELGRYLELAGVVLTYWRYRQFNVVLRATSTEADRSRFRETLALVAAIAHGEGRPLVPAHVRLAGTTPSGPVAQPSRPIASIVWG